METIKNIRTILIFASNVMKTPALIYHELCHLLMCLLTRTKVTDISIRKTESFKKDFSYEVGVYTVTSSYFKNLLISIAPLFGTILIYILCLYTESLLLLTYCFFSGKVFMPSEEDYLSIDAFKSDDELIAEFEDYEN